MNIEEKAKAYDEALEQTRRFYKAFVSGKNYPATDIKISYEVIFPELKESEDERIRKALICHYQGDGCLCTNEYRIDFKDIRAWLEKQGEQKPADKVEPKFHEGDWIINNEHNNVVKVLEINNEEYRLDYGGIVGTISIALIDNDYHLWTIQDAKDGDVLDANGAPFIYKRHDKDYVYFYCGINLAGEFIEANEKDTWNNNNKVYPATKEQHDLLFQGMKEAGYEWDVDKK